MSHPETDGTRDHAPEVAGSNRLEKGSLGEIGPPSAPVTYSLYQIFYIC